MNNRKGVERRGGRMRLLRWGVLVVTAVLLSGCPAKLDDVDRLVRDGNDYFKNQDYERALEAFTQALELKPGEPGILVNRGNVRMMLDDNVGALADFVEWKLAG